MKKRILLAITVLLVLGLGIAAFAYTTTNHSPGKSMSCCCKDGVCPMKGQGAATGEQTASCCDSPDCCCKGGSCPMKNKSDATGQTDVDMKNVKFVSGDENCDKPCCKHKKQG
jgi:hypothetical protein